MKSILVIFLFLGLTTNSIDFYTIFSNDSIEEITNKLNSLEQVKNKTVIDEAYIAALTMKKSSFEKDVKKKIKSFKIGAFALENLITSYPENIELRFIRLIIQENSPKILKYNTEIQNDVIFIKNHYKSSNKELQLEMKKYSFVSNYLKF